MLKRNIAIGILILIIIAIFCVAIYLVFPHNKNGDSVKNESEQPVFKISDVIGEAVYMGSYSTDEEVFADEQFSAKDILRAALVKSSGLPENVPVMIESYNYDNLSVCFDDGRTMRTLEQPGMATVMIVASIPKAGGDVYYAYNVQISVNESRIPANTLPPDVTGSDMKLITHPTGVTTVKPFDDKWGGNYGTTAVTKKTWTKVTTAPSVTKPSVTKPSATNPVTEAPATEPVTEAPVVTEAPSPEPVVTDPVQEESPEPVVPDPPSEPVVPDPPAEPEPPSEGGEPVAQG